MISPEGFALWITGLPSSGKSAIAREVRALLAGEGVRAVVLESDEMRTILTPAATYEPEERQRFYHQLTALGELLTRQGCAVIFDATANRRAFRDQARSCIGRFMEVFVRCPLEVCRERDPKGIYARAAAGQASTVPGLQEEYESPLSPEVIVDCRRDPQENAAAIHAKIKEFRYL